VKRIDFRIRRAACATAVVALCAVLPSCARPRLAPTPEDTAWAATQWPGTTDAVLEAGYAVYRKRCSGCHHLPLPDAHTPEKWTRTIPEMAGKAKLTAEQEDDVLRYILAVRTRS
jgi:hypothetical protein